LPLSVKASQNSLLVSCLGVKMVKITDSIQNRISSKKYDINFAHRLSLDFQQKAKNVQQDSKTDRRQSLQVLSKS
jgi:hypothetical protein